jgi:hypothetical protein
MFTIFSDITKNDSIQEANGDCHFFKIPICSPAVCLVYRPAHPVIVIFSRYNYEFGSY